MSRKPVLLPVILAGLLGLMVGAFVIAVFRPTLFSDHAIQAGVRDTLRANPELVLEAVQALQARDVAARRVQQRAAIIANRSALFDDPNSVVIGNPQGDVTLVEFFDYRCPYCRESLKTVKALVKADPKLRVVFKDFAALGPESLIAARLAVAARKDAKYEALHDALMVAPGPFDEEAVLSVAADLGLDRAALAPAMFSPEVETILATNYALAQGLMIEGTPAFIIGDAALVGVVALEELQRLIADMRARGGDAALAKSGG